MRKVFLIFHFKSKYFKEQTPILPKLQAARPKFLHFEIKCPLITLIQTDRANNLAYSFAIENIAKSSLSLSLSSSKRITLKNLRKTNQFSDIELKAIKNLKDSSYPEYLEHTFLNQNLFEIILRFYLKNQMILLTNASESRTILLLKYYHIDKYFSHIFCNTQGNKFLNCMESLRLNAENMLVFENENLQVQYALRAGIAKDRIIQIKNFGNEI